MANTDLQLYTATDIENARTKGQVVGWVQGAGTLFVLGLVLKVVGWIPALLIVGGVVWLGSKVLGRK
jgi:hypothetical protein